MNIDTWKAILEKGSSKRPAQGAPEGGQVIATTQPGVHSNLIS